MVRGPAGTGTRSSAVVGAVDEIIIPDYILNPNMEMPVKRYNGQDYIGILEIPVHGVRLPIAAGWDKNSVRKYPCRFSGSVWDGTLIIGAGADHFSFAERVDAGTAVFVTDMCGRRFAYTKMVPAVFGI